MHSVRWPNLWLPYLYLIPDGSAGERSQDDDANASNMHSIPSHIMASRSLHHWYKRDACMSAYLGKIQSQIKIC